MGSRKFEFCTGEYYHVYNRGVDGRLIVQDNQDSNRLLRSMDLLNSTLSIGSIYERERLLQTAETNGEILSLSFGEPLVEVICHCLNPNHIHLILRQLRDGGISKYLQKIGTSTTKYFNEKHHRRGSLFESKFKAIHIEDNDYLLHLSAYVNLNFRVHNIKDPHLNLVRSSWEQFRGVKDGICKTDIILDQFLDSDEYVRFSEDSLELMLRSKEEQSELKMLEFEL